MTALELIKEEMKDAHELFNGTVGDITEDQLHKDPGGKAFPIGATYAHLVVSEDVIMHSMVIGKQPLYETNFKNNTGLSEPMPPMDENWSDANEKWGRSVQVDLKKLREYSKAVFEATEVYLNTLQDNDVDKEIDLGDWGKKTLANLLYTMIIGHTYSLAGELSALKGIQGAKGYPF